MASENLARLQATVNRFADLGEFSPLTIDGGMGSSTENATQNALVAACTKAGDPANSTDMVCNLMNQMNNAFSVGGGQSYIMSNVQSLTSELDAAGNKLFLGAAASVALTKPITAPTTLADKSAFKVTAPSTAGPIDKARLWFRQLSTPMQVGVGAAGVFGIFGIWGMIAKRKKGA